MEIKYTDTIILFRAIVRWISSIIRRVANKETFKKCSKFNYLNYRYPLSPSYIPAGKIPVEMIRVSSYRDRCDHRSSNAMRKSSTAGCSARIYVSTDYADVLRMCATHRRRKESERERYTVCYDTFARMFRVPLINSHSSVRCAGFRTRAAHRAHSCTRALMHIHTHK